MASKVCVVCGKRFYSKSTLVNHCSKTCQEIAKEERRNKREQLCCRCQNACGGCSWSRKFVPVDGWVANPTIIKDSEGDITSYRIISCPEFVEG